MKYLAYNEITIADDKCTMTAVVVVVIYKGEDAVMRRQRMVTA